MHSGCTIQTMVPVYWELAIQGGADRFVYRHNVLSVNTFPPVRMRVIRVIIHSLIILSFVDDVDVLSFRNIKLRVEDVQLTTLL